MAFKSCPPFVRTFANKHINNYDYYTRLAPYFPKGNKEGDCCSHVQCITYSIHLPALSVRVRNNVVLSLPSPSLSLSLSLRLSSAHGGLAFQLSV